MAIAMVAWVFLGLFLLSFSVGNFLFYLHPDGFGICSRTPFMGSSFHHPFDQWFFVLASFLRTFGWLGLVSSTRVPGVRQGPYVLSCPDGFDHEMLVSWPSTNTTIFLVYWCFFLPSSWHFPIPPFLADACFGS
jgi:hypothetical protein